MGYTVVNGNVAHFIFGKVPEFLQEQKQLTPDDLETGETVKTPRGTFHVTAMSREQIEAAGYGFHHQSDDGKYLIIFPRLYLIARRL